MIYGHLTITGGLSRFGFPHFKEEKNRLFALIYEDALFPLGIRPGAPTEIGAYERERKLSYFFASERDTLVIQCNESKHRDQ